jgi:hypothetical protein
MLKCLCGKPATHTFWDQPRCAEHIESVKRCFKVWPPIPGSLADEAIETIPAEPRPQVPRKSGTFQFWLPE